MGDEPENMCDHLAPKSRCAWPPFASRFHLREAAFGNFSVRTRRRCQGGPMPHPSSVSLTNPAGPPGDQLSPNLSSIERLSLLALSDPDTPEITQRRQAFRTVERFFGLDVHRDYMVATAVDPDLRIVTGPTRVTWEHFEAWIERTLTHKDAIVVEMTTNTWQIYDRLVDRVHSVTVVHPPHVKLITQTPVMNDKKAAEALAILLAAGLLRSVWVPDTVVRDRRQLVAQRYDRVCAATQAKNRMHAILFRHQIDKPEAREPFSAKQRDFWRSLPVSPVEKLGIELDLATLDLAEAQRAKLEAFMTQEILKDERLPFLLQIPGLSLLGALTILAAIGPIERFPIAKKLVGYAGLGARVHDSGQTRSTGKITKAGRRDLRRVMVDTAQAASRSHDFWKAELARLEPRLGRNKAMVAIARKLLVVVWHVLTKREADRHADPQQVAEHLLNRVYTDVGARNLPDGQTAAEFVRNSLDTLKLGKDLQRVKLSRKHNTLLPPSNQPGAAPAAEPKGRGRVQNTKAAQEKRKTDAAAKRAAIVAKREATAAQKGKPRQPRSDKGVKRGPHAKK